MNLEMAPSPEKKSPEIFSREKLKKLFISLTSAVALLAEAEVSLAGTTGTNETIVNGQRKPSYSRTAEDIQKPDIDKISKGVPNSSAPDGANLGEVTTTEDEMNKKTGVVTDKDLEKEPARVIEKGETLSNQGIGENKN